MLEDPAAVRKDEMDIYALTWKVIQSKQWGKKDQLT